MTVVIDPLLIGVRDGDQNRNTTDDARTGGARINANFAALKAAVDPLQTAPPAHNQA